MSGADFSVKTIPTQPIAGQKTGTSGLRKKVVEFASEHYLENWVQSLFLALHELGHLKSEDTGAALVVGGDGRFYNLQALQKIIKAHRCEEDFHLFCFKLNSTSSRSLRVMASPN